MDLERFQKITSEQIISVVQAYKDGKKIQYRQIGSKDWDNIYSPTWNFSDYEYRIKPEPRHFLVNVYTNPSPCLHIHQSQKDADFSAALSRSECIEVVEVIKD